MDALANAFDKPIDSAEHKDLAESIWMGGGHLALRYWLGRIFDRNLFRESEAVVYDLLRIYLDSCTCHNGALLCGDSQLDSAFATIIAHQVRGQSDSNPQNDSRQIAAIWAALKDPEMTNSQIAHAAGTTEKQIARMSDVGLIKRLWNRNKA